MNEFDLRMLEVISETHNITKAAEQLYLTQSALSRRISALEQDLDITLLTRTQQGVRFTPEGEKVLACAAKAEELFQDMRTSLELEKGIVSGTLYLGVTDNYATYRLADVFTPFRLAYPKVTTNIVTDRSRRIFARLEGGLIDVAIIRGEYHWPEQTVLLDTESLYAIRGACDRGKPLDRIPYIGRLAGRSLDRKIRKWLEENHLDQEPPRISVENISTIVAMVERGLGWAIVPEIDLGGFTGISEPLFYRDGSPLVHSTYLMYSERARRLPQVDAFIKSILTTYGLAPDGE